MTEIFKIKEAFEFISNIFGIFKEFCKSNFLDFCDLIDIYKKKSSIRNSINMIGIIFIIVSLIAFYFYTENNKFKEQDNLENRIFSLIQNYYTRIKNEQNINKQEEIALDQRSTELIYECKIEGKPCDITDNKQSKGLKIFDLSFIKLMDYKEPEKDKEQQYQVKFSTKIQLSDTGEITDSLMYGNVNILKNAKNELFIKRDDSFQQVVLCRMKSTNPKINNSKFSNFHFNCGLSHNNKPILVEIQN